MVYGGTNIPGGVVGHNIGLDARSIVILDEALAKGWPSWASFIRAAVLNSALSSSFVAVSPSFKKPSFNDIWASAPSSTP